MIPLPNSYTTDVLTDAQLDFMARFLPEPLSYTGRPAYTNSQLLPGILRLLRSGCRWRDLSLPDYPSGVTYWRRLRFWEEKGIFLKTLYRLLDILIIGKRLDFSVVSIDGTLIPSYEFKEVTGYSGKHRQVGVKVSVLVDKHGTPLSFSYAPGNYHDQILSYPTLKNSYTVPKVLLPLANAVFQGRRSLLADRGYDSLYFRRFANLQGYDGFPIVSEKFYTVDDFNSHITQCNKMVIVWHLASSSH